MQVYKVFFRILNKQKIQIMMYLLIFFGISIVMSYQGEDTQSGMFKAHSHKLVIFDEDGSELSQGMAAYLREGNEEVKIEDDKETIQDELYNRSIHCVIRIPKGYGRSLTEGGEAVRPEVQSIPGTIYAETFKTMTGRYSSIAKAYREGGMDPRQVAKKTAEACQEKVPVTLAEGGRESSHQVMYYFFAYFPYIFISISVVGIGPILVVFHKKEVRERNICSCYPLQRTNFELYGGMITTEIGFCLCYFLMVFAAMKERTQLFSFQGLMYCLNVFCFMVVTLGIVFLVGEVVKKNSVLNMISNIIALGMCFLCGIFVPLEFLGDSIIKAAHFLPAYWYITSASWIDRYVPGQAMGELWRGMGIQLLFGAALFGVGLAYSREKVAAGQRE